jgi:hypothetical protein
MKRIASRGLLTLSLVVVLLAATASSASAFRTLSPPSTNFGDRQIGTTSPPQAFTLTVSRSCFPIFGCFSDSLAVAPSVSPQYAQTHNCPAVLAVAANDPVPKSCTINVTFTPLSTGPKPGMLCTNSQAGVTSGCRVVSDPGPSATLTGNGVTFPTPPTPPTPGAAPASVPLQLLLDAKKQELKKRLTFFATTNVDATLLAVGSVKQTTMNLTGAVKTKIQARLKPKKFKQLAQTLDRTGKAKAKIEATATSPTGGTVIDAIKVKLKD